jgi:hypothetical protein
MKNKTFKKLLLDCLKTVYLDQTRFQLDNKDYYLDATFKHELLPCFEVYQGEKKVELTEKQELMLLKSMQDYTESQVDNSAFTNQDYDHFESLIHN